MTGSAESASATRGDGTVRLAPLQRRIWASQRLHPDAPLANMGDPVRIAGPLDVERLRASFDAVVRASEVLRMVVVDADTARLLADPPATTDVVEVPADERDAWMAERISTPIDAARCVYDSVVLRHADDDWTWWLCIHHVAVDASASSLVLRATAAAYSHDGDPADADLSSIIDPAFFEWVAAIHDDAAAFAPRDAGGSPSEPSEPVTLGFPPAPPRTESERHPITFDSADTERIDEALAGPLRSISRELSLVSLAALGTARLVHRLDGRRTVVVGVPLHHRMRKSDRRRLGPMMELAPLVVEVDPLRGGADEFADVMRSLVDLLRTPPGTAGTAKFDVVVNAIGADAPSFGGASATRSWVRSLHDDPSQRLGVQIRVSPDGGAEWLLDLDPGLAPDDVRPALANWLGTEILTLAGQPSEALADLGIVVVDEHRELARLVPEPEPRELEAPIHEQIVDVLAADPDRIVLEHGEARFSAADVDERSRRVAARLGALGVGVGDAVGVEMERSAEVVIAVLGVLRAGAVFVFLDPDDPVSRREQMIDDAAVTTVIDDLDGLIGPADRPDDRDDADAAPDLPTVSLDDGAYILFTSGSTGRPKGVPVSHRGLADYLGFACATYVDDGAPPVVALHSKLRFDLTITSLFLGLLTGGTTVVFDGEPVDALHRVALDPRVTFLKATPTQLDVYCRFVDGSSSVDTVVVGGEAFRRPTAEAARAACGPGVRIFNEYGPTEAVVGCMIHEYDARNDIDADVPIGRACDGAQLVLLDQVGQLAPPGAWGELVVRRPGQPSGYVGQSEPVDRFVELAGVADLDLVVPGGSVGTWYVTGDRARIIRPGVLVYGGRSDEQLKVGGVRLEPGEVEAVLAGHPAVGAVVVRANASGDEVIAWWQPSSPSAQTPTPDELCSFAASRLPRHAVPAAFVSVAAMPLAASAKVDVSRLPRPEASDRPGGNGVSPATATERAVTRAWQRALDSSSEPSVVADLREIGTSSLGLLETIAIVEDEYGVELPIAAAVAAPTIRALAAVVDDAVAAGDRARYGPDDLIEPTIGEPLSLSPSEEALLFEHRADPTDIRYHGGRIFLIDAAVELDQLAEAIRDVVEHHPSLHTAYDAARSVLGVDRALDLARAEPMTVDDFERLVERVRTEPFDLDHGPLVRARLAPLTDGRTALFVGKHHINGDAGTFEVIWRHVAARLRGDELPEPTVSYAAHLAAQRRRHQRVDDPGRRFWLERLRESGAPRPPAFDAVAGAADGYLRVDAAVTGAELDDTGRSAFVHGLAALAATIAEAAGDDRADFTAAVSTRDLAAARDLVGNYLNTVPVSLEVRPDATWSELVTAAGAWTSEALAHRTVPFATIVRDARDQSVSPPSGSILLVADRAEQVDLDGAPVEQRAVLSGRAVTDLTFFIRDRGPAQPVELALEYRGSSIPADVAERLLSGFAHGLRSAVTMPDAAARSSFDDAADLVGASLIERSTVLDRWVAAAAAAPSHEAIATSAGERIDHRTLRARAEAIAAAVSAATAGRPARVGVSVERSVDLVAAMIGGQLAGGAVVPIDPTLPAARRATIAGAAGLDVVVATSSAEVPGDGSWPVVVLDELTDQPTDRATDRAADLGSGDETRAAGSASTGQIDGDAYVIFTSGSTGTPRGVAVSHQNLAASTAARSQWFDAEPARFLVTSSFGFDSSAVGLWWTLATGGTIVMPADDDVHDVDALADLIERERVSHVLMVPSLYDALLTRAGSRLAGLHTVIVAGEACPSALAKAHHRVLPAVELVNEYGPTEATVWSTVHRVGADDDPVPIGRPIPGMTARVAGPAGRSVAAGVVGELWVSGPGVTAGYLDDGVATSRRFVEHSGRRWYRTGDTVVGRDGVLLFVGRVDDQLNVGGVRVEPTEIEDAVRSLPGVDDAVAVAAGRPVRLVAHVVASNPADGLDEAAMRRMLADRLPAGAVPSRIVLQPRLPRTPNGKLDRSAAAELAINTTAVDDVAANDHHDEPLASIIDAWRSTFDQPITPDTDFFDVGGDSLSAVVLVTELAARLDREVPIAAVVTGRTPAGMAESLSAGQRAHAADALQVVHFATGADDGPVVVMTPAWDDVFGYQLLARAMPDDVSVVAFGLTDVRAVTEVDPFVDLVVERLLDDGLVDRPLVIVGWSIGGVTAMELASRLDAAGRDVRAVGLVDTFFPGEEEHIWSNRWWKYRSLLTLRALPEWRNEIGKAVSRRAQRLRKMVGRRLPRRTTPGVRRASDSERVAPSADGAAAAAGPTSPVATATKAPAPVPMIGSMPAAAFEHQPSPVEVPVVFFAASGTNPARTHRRWRTVASELSVIPVQGRHRGFESVMGAGRVDQLVVGLLPHLRR